MLEFSVVNQKLTRIDMFYSVRDSKDYLTASFDFRTDDWAGMTKTAVFNIGDKDGSTYTLLMDGNTVKLPEACLKSSFVNISVFGVADGVRITTNVVRVELKSSGYAEGETPPEPSETVYENILKKCTEAVSIADAVQARADSGEFTGEKGEKGDKGDKGDTGATGATGPQGPPGKDAVTDTELSTESDNAIANSTVSKVLAYGNLIGFEKIDSYEEFEEFNAKYPVGVSEDDFLVLYITSDLSYSDINGSFDCPPGLYVITADNFFRLCPDAESVNSQFKAVDEAMRTWVGLVGIKANQVDLDRVKEDLSTVVEDLNTVSDAADEALREISVSNRDIANYLEVADILGIWKNATAGRTSFANLFENSTVKEVPLFDTSDGTNFASMFKGCEQLESVPLFDTSKALSFLNMFYGCVSLKSLPAFSTPKLTNSFGMVRGCTSLISFKGIDTSKVTNMNGMFYGCTSLEEVEVDTSSVSDGNYVFYRCESLRSVKTLDFSNITSLSGQFYQCFNLESVEFVPESIRVSMSVSDCSKLNSDSVVSIFAGLADLTDSDAQTLTLHKNVQITQAQADAAVAKNWNIVGGTVNG